MSKLTFSATSEENARKYIQTNCLSIASKLSVDGRELVDYCNKKKCITSEADYKSICDMPNNYHKCLRLVRLISKSHNADFLIGFIKDFKVITMLEENGSNAATIESHDLTQDQKPSSSASSMQSGTSVLPEKLFQFTCENLQPLKECCAHKSCQTVLSGIPSPVVQDVFIQPTYEVFSKGKNCSIEHENICESLLRNRTNVTVVSGEIGTGKSTVLKQLAYKWSVKEVDNAWFVVPVDCAKINRSYKQIATFVELLKSYSKVDESITKILELVTSNRLLEKPTDLRENVLFLLDNLDQYINSDGTTFCHELNVMLGMESDNSCHINKWRIIAFTRPYAALKMFKHGVANTRHYKLRGFGKQAIMRSLQTKGFNVNAALLEDVRQWHKSLPKQERVAIRTVSPLLFALRDNVHTSSQLPDNISVIFYHALEFMLKQSHRILWWQKSGNFLTLRCFFHPLEKCSGNWCKPVLSTRSYHDMDSNQSHYPDCCNFLKKWLQNTNALMIITYTHYDVKEIAEVTGEFCPHLILESGIFTPLEDANPAYVKAINHCFLRYIVAVHFREILSNLSYEMFEMPLNSPDHIQTGFKDIGDGILLQSTLTIRLVLFLELFLKLPNSGDTAKVAEYAWHLISKQGSRVYVQLLPPLQRIANACIHPPSKDILNDFIRKNSTFQEASQDYIHEQVMVYLSELPTFSAKYVMLDNFCYQVCTPNPAKSWYFIQQKDGQSSSKPASQLPLGMIDFFAYNGTLCGLFEFLRSTTFTAVDCLLSLTDGDSVSEPSKPYVLTRRRIDKSGHQTAVVTVLCCKITAEVELMIVEMGKKKDTTDVMDCDNNFSFFNQLTINNYFFIGTPMQYYSLHDDNFVHKSAKHADIYIPWQNGTMHHWELEMNNLTIKWEIVVKLVEIMFKGSAAFDKAGKLQLLCVQEIVGPTNDNVFEISSAPKYLSISASESSIMTLLAQWPEFTTIEELFLQMHTTDDESSSPYRLTSPCTSVISREPLIVERSLKTINNEYDEYVVTLFTDLVNQNDVQARELTQMPTQGLGIVGFSGTLEGMFHALRTIESLRDMKSILLSISPTSTFTHFKLLHQRLAMGRFWFTHVTSRSNVNVVLLEEFNEEEFTRRNLIEEQERNIAQMEREALVKLEGLLRSSETYLYLHVRPTTLRNLVRTIDHLSKCHSCIWQNLDDNRSSTLTFQSFGVQEKDINIDFSIVNAIQYDTSTTQEIVLQIVLSEDKGWSKWMQNVKIAFNCLFFYIGTAEGLHVYCSLQQSVFNLANSTSDGIMNSLCGIPLAQDVSLSLNNSNVTDYMEFSLMENTYCLRKIGCRGSDYCRAAIITRLDTARDHCTQCWAAQMPQCERLAFTGSLLDLGVLLSENEVSRESTVYYRSMQPEPMSEINVNSTLVQLPNGKHFYKLIIVSYKSDNSILLICLFCTRQQHIDHYNCLSTDTLTKQHPKMLAILVPDISELMMCIAHRLLPYNAKQILLNIDASLTFPNNNFRPPIEDLWLQNEIFEIHGQYFGGTLCQLNATTPIALLNTKDVTVPTNGAAKSLCDFEAWIVVKPEQLAAMLRKNISSPLFKSSQMYFSTDTGCTFGQLSHNVWSIVNSRHTVYEIVLSSNQEFDLVVNVESHFTTENENPENPLCLSKAYFCNYFYYAGSVKVLSQLLTNRPVKAKTAEFHMYNLTDSVDSSKIIASLAPVVATDIDTRVYCDSLQLPPEDLKLELTRLILNEHYWLCMIDDGTLRSSTATPLSADNFGNLLQHSKPWLTIFLCRKQFLQFLSSDISSGTVKDLTVVIEETSKCDESRLADGHNEGTIRVFSMNEPEWYQPDKIAYKFYYLFEPHFSIPELFILATRSTGPYSSTNVLTHRQLTSVTFSGTIEAFMNLVANGYLPFTEKNVCTFPDSANQQDLYLVRKKSEVCGYIVDQFTHNESSFIVSIAPSTIHPELLPKDLEPTVSWSQYILYAGDRDNLEILLENISFNVGQHYAKLTHVTALHSMLVVWTKKSIEARLRSQLVILQNVNAKTAKSAELIYVTMPSQEDMKFTELTSYNFNKSTVTIKNFTNINRVNKFTFSGTLRNFILLLASRTEDLSITVGSFSFLTQCGMQVRQEVNKDKLRITRDFVFVVTYQSFLNLSTLRFNKLSFLHLEEDCKDKSNYRYVDNLIQISSEVDILSFSGSINTFFSILFDFLNIRRDVARIDAQFSEYGCFTNVGLFASNRDRVHLYKLCCKGGLLPETTMLPGKTFNYAELSMLNQDGQYDLVALLIKGAYKDLSSYFAQDIYKRREEHHWDEVAVVFDGDHAALLELLLLLKLPKLVVYTRLENPPTNKQFYSMQTTFSKTDQCKGVVCADMQYTDKKLPTDTTAMQFRIVQETQTPVKFPLSMCTASVPTVWRISCSTLLGIYGQIHSSWQCPANQSFHVCIAKQPGTFMISPRCELFCTTLVKVGDYLFVCMGLLNDANVFVVSLKQQTQAASQKLPTKDLNVLFRQKTCPAYVHIEASFSAIYEVLPAINKRKISIKLMHITLKPECMETTADICYPTFKQAGHILTNNFTAKVLNWKLLVRSLRLKDGVVMHVSQMDDASDASMSEDFAALHEQLRYTKLLCFTGQWDAFITFCCQSLPWQVGELDKLWVNFTKTEDDHSCRMLSDPYDHVRPIRSSHDYSVIPFQNEADNAVKFSVILQNHNLIKLQCAALPSTINEILAEQEQWCYYGARDGLLNLLANAEQIRASNISALLSSNKKYFVSHTIDHYYYNADSNRNFDIFDIKQQQHNSLGINIVTRFVKEGKPECANLCAHSFLSWPVQSLEVFGSVNHLLNLVRGPLLSFGVARFMISKLQLSETHELTLNAGQLELKSGCEYSVADWQALMQNDEIVLLDVRQSPNHPTEVRSADWHHLHKKHINVFTYHGTLGILARLFMDWNIFVKRSTICLNDVNTADFLQICSLAQTQLCVTDHHYNVRILRQNETCALYLMYSVSDRADETCIRDSCDVIPDCTYLYVFCGYIEDFASIVVNGKIPKECKMHYLFFKNNITQHLSFENSLQLSKIVEHQCISNNQFEVFSVHNKQPNSGNNPAFVYVVERTTTNDVGHFDVQCLKCDILVLSVGAETVGQILRQVHFRTKTLQPTDIRTEIYVCRSKKSRQVGKLMQVENNKFSMSVDTEPNFFYEGDVYSWFDKQWSLVFVCNSSIKSTTAEFRDNDCQKSVNFDKFTSFDWFEYFGPINHFAICFTDREFNVKAGKLTLSTDRQDDISREANMSIDRRISGNVVSVDTVQVSNAGLRLTHICIDKHPIAAALLNDNTAVARQEETISNRGDSEVISLVYVGTYAKLSSFLSHMRDYENYLLYIRTSGLFVNGQVTHNEDSFRLNAVCRVVNCTNHLPPCRLLRQHNKDLARFFYLNQANLMNNTNDTFDSSNDTIDTLDMNDSNLGNHNLHLVGTLQQLIFNFAYNTYPKSSSGEYLLQLLPDEQLILVAIDQDRKGQRMVIKARITAADSATINLLSSRAAVASSAHSVQHLRIQQELQAIKIELFVSETFLKGCNFMLVELSVNGSTYCTALMKGNDQDHKISNSQESNELDFVVKALENVPLLYYIGDAQHLCTLLQYPKLFHNVGNLRVSLSEKPMHLQESFESLELSKLELICSNSSQSLHLLALLRNNKPPLGIVAACIRSEVAGRAGVECKFLLQIGDINHIDYVCICGSPMILLNSTDLLGKCKMIKIKRLQNNTYYPAAALMTNLSALSTNSLQLFSTTTVLEDLIVVKENLNVQIAHHESINSGSIAKQAIFIGTAVGLCVWLLGNSSIQTVSFEQSSQIMTPTTSIFQIPSGSYNVLIERTTEYNSVRLQNVSNGNTVETYFYSLRDKSTLYSEKPKLQSIICVNSMENLARFVLSLNVFAEQDLQYEIIAPRSRSKCAVKSFSGNIIERSTYDMHAIETEHGTLQYFCNRRGLKTAQRIQRKISGTAFLSRIFSNQGDVVVCADFVLFNGSVRHFIRFATDKNVKLHDTVRLLVRFIEWTKKDEEYMDKEYKNSEKKTIGSQIASAFFDARSQPTAVDAVMRYLAPLLRLNENTVQHYFFEISQPAIARNVSSCDSISVRSPAADNEDNSSTSTDLASAASNDEQTSQSATGEPPDVVACQHQQVAVNENDMDAATNPMTTEHLNTSVNTVEVQMMNGVCAQADADRTPQEGERNHTGEGLLLNDNEQ